MDINDIKKGDILAYKGKNPISKIVKKLTNSNYSHLCLYIGNSVFVEADWNGIQYCNIDKYKNYLDIYTCDLTDIQRQQICDYAISKVGEKYDYGLLIFMFLRQIFKFRFRIRDRNSDVCSELVNDSYSEANGMRLVKKRYPSPQEVINSERLKFVGSY